MKWLLGSVIFFLVIMVGFLFFVASAYLAGHQENIYRCRDYGVIEKAGQSWGLRTTFWTDMGVSPSGVCK